MLRRRTHSRETSFLLIHKFRKITLPVAGFCLFGTRSGFLSVLVLLSVLIVLAPALGQDQDRTPGSPSIVSVSPASAAPQTSINVEGYRMRSDVETAGRV